MRDRGPRQARLAVRWCRRTVMISATHQEMVVAGAVQTLGRQLLARRVIDEELPPLQRPVGVKRQVCAARFENTNNAHDLLERAV